MARRRAPVITLFLGTLACSSAGGQDAPPAPPAPPPAEPTPPAPPAPVPRVPPVDRVASLEPGRCVVVYARDCPTDQADCPAETYGQEAIDCPRSLMSQVSERQLVLERNDRCVAKAVSSCPPGARCNPPRPEPVDCPERLRSRVERRDDGTCLSFAAMQCPVSCDGCPPVPTCNPPPPRPVPCP